MKIDTNLMKNLGQIVSDFDEEHMELFLKCLGCINSDNIYCKVLRNGGQTVLPIEERLYSELRFKPNDEIKSLNSSLESIMANVNRMNSEQLATFAAVINKMHPSSFSTEETMDVTISKKKVFIDEYLEKTFSVSSGKDIREKADQFLKEKN